MPRIEQSQGSSAVVGDETLEARVSQNTRASIGDVGLIVDN
jgi:hypothetical protein